jgi:GNAT superfamily N-acetyltransferase
LPQPSRPEFHSEALDGTRHDREGFSCGNQRLDNYLRNRATQDVRKRVAVAFVLTPDGKTIAGYYTLSQYAVQLDLIPQEIARRFPKYPEIPATLIGRLARSTAFRGHGIGELLLLDALERILSSTEQVASAAVVVDAKDDEAKRFYLKYQFIELPGHPNRLFLPMGTVKELLDQK